MQQQLKYRLNALALSIATVCQAGLVSASELPTSPFEISHPAADISTPAASQQIATYIVQLAGQSGVEKAAELGQLKPNPLTGGKNLYNSTHPAIVAHNASLKALQEKLASQFSNHGLLYSYTHTFNGFTAQMTQAQAEQLKLQAGVIGVWLDEPEQIQTSRTATLLGLTGPEGQHTLGVKGENLIIGVVDTGISPTNPSFADDGSFAPLERFKGICDKGEDAEFACSNKLIGARYFNSSFVSRYALQPGEFVSPRDADNHGSHVASTAAGNEGVAASIGGVALGNITGMAPRARIAVYKACWNSNYTSPAGDRESGCFPGDTMAALDAAVADGVDVINYSISGSRDDLTTAPTAAMLRAVQAGVLVAVSAGNNGASDAKGTVGSPAPWVINVASSGFTIDAVKVNSGLAAAKLVAVEGTVAKPLNVTGPVTADVVVASPLTGCEPLTNAPSVAGKIVLIQRGGGCGFAVKLEQAQNAGAKALLVYNNVAGNPTAMGGSLAGPTIPALMVKLDDGDALKTALEAGNQVNLTFDPTLVANAMADSSSKGPSLATGDVLKPDIAAPGVNILAAATPTTFTKPAGNNFAYLSGTSMASPHIAGLALLIKQQHPNWTPAMIKSALMTTARQNVNKTSSSLLADPFDFGAGHVVPVSAANPGLVYDTSPQEYFAFLCGLGKSTFVLNESGISCAQYDTQGYPTEAMQLNQPAIAVSELKAAKTIVRVVKDVSGNNANYVPTIEAPAGVQVSFKKLVNNTFVQANSLDVPANGHAIYALTLTPSSAAILDTYAFGSLTLSDGVHQVRSPIAVKPMAPDAIKAPATLTTTVNAASGRLSFVAEYMYTGSTSAKLAGLSPAFGAKGTVSQDTDGTFAFKEAGLGRHNFLIPPGTQLARFTLRNNLTDLANSPNIDLYVYRCIASSCSFVTSSLNAEANEDILLPNPAPANDAAKGDYYIVWTHARDLKGAASASYTLANWVVGTANPATSTLIASSRAISGRPNVVAVTSKNLVAGSLPYMGVVALSDQNAQQKTSTVLEVFAK